MKSPLSCIAAGTASLALLTACGGRGEGDTASSAFETDTSFRAYAQAYPGNASSSTASSSAPLTVAQAAEVAQLSRDWAVAALDGGSISYIINAMTLPSLHFARLTAVAAAAHGDTLTLLQQQAQLPSSEAVAAGLVHGIKRSISALTDGNFKPAFMRVATADGYPGTWASLTLYPLSASQLSVDGNMRMQIDDDAGRSGTWPQAALGHGLFQSGGDYYRAPVVRVQGPLLRYSRATYTAAGLAMAGGGWLIQITPATNSPDWLGAALKTALADVATAIAAQPATATSTGELVLPLLDLGAPESRGEGAGMSQALDPVHADLRGLDQGGTYLKASDMPGGMGFTAEGFNVRGGLSTAFVFSPLNINGGTTAGAIGTNVNAPPLVFGSPPACPADAVPLRAFYLVLMQANGSISLLARIARFDGTRCR